MARIRGDWRRATGRASSAIIRQDSISNSLCNTRPVWFGAKLRSSSKIRE